MVNIISVLNFLSDYISKSRGTDAKNVLQYGNVLSIEIPFIFIFDILLSIKRRACK